MKVGRLEVQDYTWLHSELKGHETLPQEEMKKKKDKIIDEIYIYEQSMLHACIRSHNETH